MSMVCRRCGASFSCGMKDEHDAAPCWCTELPPLTSKQLEQLHQGNPAPACYCPACLREALDGRAD